MAVVYLVVTQLFQTLVRPQAREVLSSHRLNPPPSMPITKILSTKHWLLPVLLSTVLPIPVHALNTTDIFQNGTDLLAGANWSAGLPTVANDAVFNAGFPLAASTLTMSAGNLTVGSLNSLNANAITVSNQTTGATNSILTLGGAGATGNQIAGAAATDLLFVGTGSTLTLKGPNDSTGTGTLRLALGQTGTFNVAGTGILNISAALSGATFGITKTGTGTLNFSGANTYTGGTLISAGTVNFTGAASSTTTSTLNIDNGVMNVNTTGALTFVQASGPISIGNNGSGALNLAAGTLTLTPAANYLEIGKGTASAYGSLNVSGGSLIVNNVSGIRVGGGPSVIGGLGVFNQSAGNISISRYLALGSGSAANPGTAVMTVTGGSSTYGTSNYKVLIGDSANSTGIMNIGTQAGGTGVTTASSTSTTNAGVSVGSNTGTTAVLNMNSGALVLNGAQTGIGAIYKTSGTSSIVNLNGGIIRAGNTGFNLLDNTPNSINVYKGGAVFDTQAFSSSVSGNLLATPGNGVYAGGSGGTFTVPTGGGSGYIGSPLVTATGGGGTGLMAVANVSGGVITGVSITAPGRNYVAGQTVSFSFTGGGATSTASTFNYTLTAADLSANTGGLTKLGTGDLTLTGTGSTYAGPTLISNGSLTTTASNIIPDASSMTLAASTRFNYGGTAETIASLNLTGNAIINMNSVSGTSILTFADVGSIAGSLSVYNWGGSLGTAGGLDQLIFNANTGGVDLSGVKFYSDSGTTRVGTSAAMIGNELVPVPEPGVWIFSLGVLLTPVLARRRRNV